MKKKEFCFLRSVKWMGFLSLFFMQSLFANLETAFNLDIITVVWGKEFTDSFLKITLPLQLCPGNMGSLPAGKACYKIFTTRNDWEAMQLHPNMKKLHEMISVEFVEITKFHPHLHRYQILNACHQQAISSANQKGHALLFLSPDNLISNQTFRTILQYVQEGKKAIAIITPRAKKELMVPLIEDVLNENASCHNGIDSRLLVKLSIPHLHIETEATCCNNEKIHACVANMFWKIDNENLFGFGFHPHPLFIWPEANVNPNSAIDNVYLSDACPSKEKWKLIQDSDEFFVVEFSDSQWHSGIEWVNCNPAYVANWGIQNAPRPHQWELFNLICFHSCDYKSEWKRIEDQASQFIRDVKTYAGK